VLAAFLPDKVYSTSAKLELSIDNTTEAGGGAVQQGAFLATALEEKARSRSLKERVAPDVPELYRNTRVDITGSVQSSVFTVRGESGSAEAAQAWVNAMADRLIEEWPADSPLTLGTIDQAPLKPRPIAPNTEPIVLAAIIVGLVAALFAALAADRVKRAFDTANAIREHLDTTLLGEVPLIGRFSRDRRRPVITMLSGKAANQDLVAAFDNIRANVEFRMSQVGADRVAVVSLGRGVGKSTITAGLAHSMAAVRPVVAIEADLRRPALSEHLGVRMALGLGDMAAFGYTDLLVQGTSIPNLKLLPAGIPVARPADVINSTLPGVLDLLSDSSETVFIDSPPLVGAVESTIIVGQAKWVILVMSGAGSELAGLTDAMQRISDAGGTVLGVVVNRVPRRRFRRQTYIPAADRRTPLVQPAAAGVPAGANGAANPAPGRAEAGRL
jgi:Mrp family chromosome partitioning ATPase